MFCLSDSDRILSSLADIFYWRFVFRSCTIFYLRLFILFKNKRRLYCYVCMECFQGSFCFRLTYVLPAESVCKGTTTFLTTKLFKGFFSELFNAKIKTTFISMSSIWKKFLTSSELICSLIKKQNNYRLLFLNQI